jgi:hypothetical protein
MNDTEEYDGTSWTAGNDFPTTIYAMGGCGTQTTGLTCGGYSPAAPNANTTITGEYDGTNWTTGGAMIQALSGNFASGSQTDAVQFGGSGPPYLSASSQYNGTSWVTTVSMATARNSLAGSGTSGATGTAFADAGIVTGKH